MKVMELIKVIAVMNLAVFPYHLYLYPLASPSSLPLILQIPHRVAQTMAAAFEASERALARASNETFLACPIGEVWRGIEYFVHMHRVVFPIGCQSQFSFCFERGLVNFF